VIFLFSGLHSDYHRPTDDADKINYDGMKKVVAVADQLAEGMAAMPREQFVAASAADPHSSMGPIPQSGSDPSANSGAGSGAYLGSVPDPEAYGAESATAGVRLAGTVPGSPAEAAGIKEGDVLVKWNGENVGSIYGMTDLLRRSKPGDQVKLGVMRDGKLVELEATLSTRKAKPD
jgi:S1-C subfamily serine protease